MRRHNAVRLASNGPRQILERGGDRAPSPEVAPAVSPEEKAESVGWVKGQLLNVRNAGEHYNVTLVGEEYDPQHPERCIQFTNLGECQNFVSRWYQPERGRW